MQFKDQGQSEPNQCELEVNTLEDQDKSEFDQMNQKLTPTRIKIRVNWMLPKVVNNWIERSKPEQTEGGMRPCTI